MVEGIEWLGHDSFRIAGSKTVYIDPWKLAAGAPQADVVLVTHDHYDHFSKPDIGAISGPETVIVGPREVAAQFGERGVAVDVGDTVEVNGVTVTAVPAYNTDKWASPGKLYHEPGGHNLGYICELDGRSVYHAGDTDVIAEMADIDVDVALLPVSGVYVMTADEAADACRTLRARVAIPMHYGEVAGCSEDAKRFREQCSLPVEILERCER